jgi:hypothetical protein
MAIKVTLGATENTQKEKPFPKLMKSTISSAIVYFTEIECGLVVVEGEEGGSFNSAPYGWDMAIFTDYNEPITIQNA